ncbi:MAG: hypothetical protein WC880_05135 [Candidatus Paceibacterota bacterium]
MKKLSEETKQHIIDELEKRKAVLPCPRCGNKNFSILDGYFVQTIQDDYKGITLGGQVVPSIAVACTRCGFLSQHALGVFGLLDKEEANDE